MPMLNAKKFVTLNSFAFRHAFSISVAVIIAVIINHYFAFSQNGWIILTAFLVGQTTRGTPLRQGLSIFFSISIALLLVTILCLVFPLVKVTALITIFFIISIFLALQTYKSQGNKNSYPWFVFALTMLVTMPVLPQQTWQKIPMQLIDIAIGSVIGIFCNQFIFRIRFVKEFRESMRPILGVLISYAEELTKYLTKQTGDIEKLIQNKMQVEETLVSQQGMYPEWVYEVGFNPGLRSGFRFFLLTLERVIEIFFSLDYLSRQQINAEWLNTLTSSIMLAMEKNIELIRILMTYFAENKLLHTQSDFTSDMVELEKSLHEIVPGQLELLDVSPDYLRLTALVRDIKDLRELLLQLVMALPEGYSVSAPVSSQT